MSAVLSVLLIAGHGRSGSTLLDLQLSRHPEVFSAGELRYLWQRGFHEDLLCGCGLPFAKCDLWQSVLRSAFGSRFASTMEAIRLLQQQVDRPDRFLLNQGLSIKRYSGTYRHRAVEFRQALHAVLQAITAITHARVIIDSSKVPSHCALVLGIAGVNASVLHLVRDARAVAYSLQRNKPRPDVHWEQGAIMPRLHPAKAALRWTVVNALCRRWQRLGSRYRLLRYEDFVRTPEGTIAEILTSLTLDPALFRSEAAVRENHSVSGNPVRHDRLMRSRIVADTEWVTRMPRWRKALVTAIALPGLLQYGYLGLGSTTPRHSSRYSETAT